MIGTIDQFTFRELHHRYLLLFNDDRNVMVASAKFPHRAGDNALLLYGYIDHEVGISFEVLCVVRYVKGHPLEFRAPSKDTSLKLRYDAIQGTLAHVNFDGSFLAYLDKVDMIDKHYKVHEAVELMRGIEGLDASRSPQFPDDIVVIFYKDGLNPEGIWVRMERNVGDKLAGKLLNQPYGDFGYNVGDYVLMQPMVIENELKAVAIL